jgi:hypothetical protein
MAPAAYLASAIVLGALLFGSLVLTWRTKQNRFRLLGLIAALIVYKNAPRLLESETMWDFFQWLSLACLSVAALLLAFRTRVSRLWGSVGSTPLMPE